MFAFRLYAFGHGLSTCPLSIYERERVARHIVDYAMMMVHSLLCIGMIDSVLWIVGYPIAGYA